jgi:chaperonin cofactor prefoldin
MKKQEMIEYLNNQMKEVQEEMNQMQEAFNAKKELLIRITGALEALNALDEDEPKTTEISDHTDAAVALGILK